MALIRSVSAAVIVLFVCTASANAQAVQTSGQSADRVKALAELLAPTEPAAPPVAKTTVTDSTPADVRLALRALGIDDELLTGRLVQNVTEQLKGREPGTLLAAAREKRFAKSLGSITIRRSFLDLTGLDKPAAVSFSSHHRQDVAVADGAERVQFETRAALVWMPAVLTLGKTRHASVSPLVGIDADVTSGLKKDADRITLRAGVRATVSPAAASFSHTVVVAYDRATDRSLEADIRGVTIQYSLIKTHKDGVDWITWGGSKTFKWRPSVGYTFLDVRDAAGVEALAGLKDTNQWYGLLETEIGLGVITVKPSGMMGQRRGSTVRTFGLGELTTAFALTDKNAPLKADLTVQLSTGHRFPKFLKERRVKIALAVKF